MLTLIVILLLLYIAFVQLPSVLIERSLSMQTRSTFNAPGVRSQYCMTSQIFQALFVIKVGKLIKFKASFKIDN